MKKTICLFLMLVCCACLLVACDPGTRSIDRVELDRVVSVELIRYDNPAQKEFISWIPDQFRELAPFVLSNATVLETLPADKIPDFLDAFSKTDILNKYYAYNSPRISACASLTKTAIFSSSGQITRTAGMRATSESILQPGMS